MLPSIHDQDGEANDVDISERLRFVAGWCRILGFILVGMWALAGCVVAVVGITSRHAEDQMFLPIGVVGATIGILPSAPLYFWFSAIASGVASLVDHSSART